MKFRINGNFLTVSVLYPIRANLSSIYIEYLFDFLFVALAFSILP